MFFRHEGTIPYLFTGLLGPAASISALPSAPPQYQKTPAAWAGVSISQTSVASLCRHQAV